MRDYLTTAPPQLAVIVPMYKVEHYIKICIDSILNQTFQDFEIIIVDDATPDNSYNICQNLYGENPKVRIVRHKHNKGLGAARNTGIENARGEYVCFVDSDDAILPNALEILYNAAKETDADIIHSEVWIETLQDDDKPIDGSKLKLCTGSYASEGMVRNDLVFRMRECWKKFFSTTWLNMYNLKFLKKNDLKFIDVISEDIAFSFDTICAAEKLVVIKNPFYIYRRRGQSIMTTYDEKRLSDAMKTLLTVSNYIKNRMANIPTLAYDRKLQEELLEHFFWGTNINHILMFYDGQNINPQVDQVIFNEFLPVFKENTALVKYLLNRSNMMQRNLMTVTAQANVIFQQNQQLQQANALLNAKLKMLDIIEELKSTAKKFLFMLTPTHGNLGDQAIVLGEYFVMQSCFPDYKIIEIPYEYMVGELGKIFADLGYQKHINPQDYIVLHGGGNLGNLWLNEELARRAVIEKFPNNRIVIFPQSVHFTNDVEGQNQIAVSSKIYNAHQDLHLMLRDEVSFATAEKIFPNVKTYLLPDIVTALFGTIDNVNVKRNGVLFVLRQDKEKVRNDTLIQQLQNVLKHNNIPFSVTDTVINETVSAQNRNQKIQEVLMKFRRSKLVITDRFHGVIFSVIARTPVAAFKPYDTKFDRFKDFPSVYYAENDNVKKLLKFMEMAYNGAFDGTVPQVWNGFRTALQENFSKIVRNR